MLNCFIQGSLNYNGTKINCSCAFLLLAENQLNTTNYSVFILFNCMTSCFKEKGNENFCEKIKFLMRHKTIVKKCIKHLKA